MKREEKQAHSFPNALTIAGSDSGGGAGIQADLKAFSALSVFGASVVTAVTAQNTRSVTAVHLVPPDVVRAQIAAVFDDIALGAIKIGMLGDATLIHAVADALEDAERTRPLPPIVLDPVMVAKSGAMLLEERATEALVARLLPMATVVTPNLPEVAVLLGAEREPSDVDEMAAAGKKIQALGAKAVLVKGGHLATTRDCVDVFSSEAAALRLPVARVTTNNTHGTGCTLSSAIAAHLALGATLEDAVRGAQRYLHQAIVCADRLSVGSGHGPVFHFHRQWLLSADDD